MRSNLIYDRGGDISELSMARSRRNLKWTLLSLSCQSARRPWRTFHVWEAIWGGWVIRGRKHFLVFTTRHLRGHCVDGYVHHHAHVNTILECKRNRNGQLAHYVFNTIYAISLSTSTNTI